MKSKIFKYILGFEEFVYSVLTQICFAVGASRDCGRVALMMFPKIIKKLISLCEMTVMPEIIRGHHSLKTMLWQILKISGIC